MTKKHVIIYVDGGFCSQILFFSLGLFFESKGYDVKYDLQWFKTFGKDIDNKFDRSFVMNQAFPNLKYKVAPQYLCKIYKRFFKKDWSENKIPNHLYIKYFWGSLRRQQFIKHKDFFVKNFKPVDLYLVKDLLKDIETDNSCAVHVRRGDLAKYDPAYGNPPAAEDFIKAINNVLKQRPDSVFYFFSDEMDWVKANIIPKLDKKVKYRLCDKNGSDKGYLDLYLISRAKSIIASQGSFGKIGRDLNINKDLLFVSLVD